MKSQPVIIVKRHKRGHQGGHGGAWKVAYADFVTAMMAFFLVMWLVGQSPAVKSAVSAYFKDPGVFDKSKDGGLLDGGKGVSTGGVEATMNAATTAANERKILEETARKIREVLESSKEFQALKKQVELMVTSEGLRIELSESDETGFFDTGSASLKTSGAEIVAVIAAQLGKLDNAVVLEGHTDSRPYSAAGGYNNWDLSVDRANAARRVMEAHGLRPHQIREVRGYADTKLRMPTDALDSRNRRVSIMVPRTAADALKPAAPAPDAKPGVAFEPRPNSH
jgi:chemotaxis protein MotB